jgi:aryl-alcohol dehydrogenase-like predicted oxidoreductase
LPIATVQNQYNIDNRKWENALTYCEKEGIGFMPWSPIGGNRGLHDNALEAAAKDYHASMVQLALAWLLHHSRVMLPIPGTSSLAHLEENMAAAKLKLTGEDWKRIDALAT